LQRDDKYIQTNAKNKIKLYTTKMVNNAENYPLNTYNYVMFYFKYTIVGMRDFRSKIPLNGLKNNSY